MSYNDNMNFNKSIHEEYGENPELINNNSSIIFIDEINKNNSGIDEKEKYEIDDLNQSLSYYNISQVQNEKLIKYALKKRYKFYQTSRICKFLIYLFSPIIIQLILFSIPLFPLVNEDGKVCISYKIFLFYRVLYTFINNLGVNLFFSAFMKNNCFNKYYISIIISAIASFADFLLFDYFYIIFQKNQVMIHYFLCIIIYINMLLYILLNLFPCLKINNNRNNGENNENAICFLINRDNSHTNDYQTYDIHKNLKLYILHNKYIYGGQINDELFLKNNRKYFIDTYKMTKLKSKLLIVFVFFSSAMINAIYILCNQLVRNFQNMKTLIGKNYVFILFYFSWFCLGRITQLTLRLWKNKIQNGIFVILLAIQINFHVHYILIFIDKKLTFQDASIIFIQNTLLKFLEVFMPMSSKFLRLKKKLPFIMKVLGHDGPREYVRFKVSFNYLIKLISLIISTFGTLAQYLAIIISCNQKAYFNFYDDAYFYISKLIFIFISELSVYIILEILIRKYYKISSWKNYYIFICNNRFMICSILLMIDIFQDPLITILVNTLETCQK